MQSAAISRQVQTVADRIGSALHMVMTRKGAASRMQKMENGSVRVPIIGVSDIDPLIRDLPPSLCLERIIDRQVVWEPFCAELVDVFYRNLLVSKGEASWNLCIRKATVAVVASHEQKVRLAMESLVLWLETMGFVTDYEDWLQRRAHSFSSLFLQGRYEAYMKFITSLVQARSLDTSGLDGVKDSSELPSRPGWLSELENHFLGGSAYVWFSTRAGKDVVNNKDNSLKAESKRVAALTLLNGITGIKKRQPEIDPTLITSTQRSWYPSLFGERKPLARPSVYSDQYVKTVAEVVDHLFTRGGFKGIRVPIPIPSLRARWDSKVKEGGTMGLFGRVFSEWVNDETKEYDLTNTYGWKHGEFTSFVDLGGGVPSALISEVVTAVPHDPLVDLAEVLACESELIATPQGLAEPFKVRMISKSQAFVTWQQSLIQKHVHTLLQRLPEMRLTKETPTNTIEDILTNVIGATLKPDTKYVSGDYKGATDNLDSFASNVVADAISKKFGYSPYVRDLFKRSLTGFVLLASSAHTELTSKERADYPNPATCLEDATYVGSRLDLGVPILGTANGVQQYFWRQTWGQLMGSPTSFPVLCLANYCATLFALRSEGTKGEARLMPGSSGIVINGDDIGFSGTDRKIQRWRSVTASIGLSPSMGKNFVSRHFIQLNSKMFVPTRVQGPVMEGSEPPMRLVLVPNPSLAVLAPPKRVSFSEWCLSAPSWQAKFLEGTGFGERERLNRIWHSIWMPYLKRIPPGTLNWYIPRQLYGLGLEPSDDDWMINGSQAAAAAYARDHITPESLRACSLRWDQPDVNTTVHRDGQKVLDRLVGLQLLNFGFLPEGVVDFTLSQHGVASVLSGWSGPVTEDPISKISSITRYTSPLISVLYGGPAQYAASVEVIPKKEKDDRLTWLTTSLKNFRKASSSTGRSMGKLDIVLYRHRDAGYYLHDGVFFTETTEVVDLRRPGVLLEVNGPKLRKCSQPVVMHLHGNTVLRINPPELPTSLRQIEDVPI